ncbi:MAG: dihydrofolate reductase family protein [Planctomycetota bacterium]
MTTDRMVTYSVAMSLDGYIAGPQGQYDWIPSDDVGIDFTAFVARFDTLLMGRKTFELTQEQGPEAQIPGMRRYVFSATLQRGDVEDVTIVPPEQTAEVVRQLKKEAGKQIWLFGGGQLFAGLLEAGLVDEVEVAVMPILLGQGVPLLPQDYGHYWLERVETTEYQRGVLLSTYRVATADR